MADLAQRGAPGQKDPKPICGTAKGFRHMGRVKALPCVICLRHGPSDAHHCQSSGYKGDPGKMARDDFKTIPLCKECHQGQQGYHNAKETWEAKNGKDHEFLAVVADMLAGQWVRP